MVSEWSASVSANYVIDKTHNHVLHTVAGIIYIIYCFAHCESDISQLTGCEMCSFNQWSSRRQETNWSLCGFEKTHTWILYKLINWLIYMYVFSQISDLGKIKSFSFKWNQNHFLFFFSNQINSIQLWKIWFETNSNKKNWFCPLDIQFVDDQCFDIDFTCSSYNWW